jgi:serine/threonine protein phosphatase PrpC
MNIVDIYGASDRGKKREKNEDAFLILDLADAAKLNGIDAYLAAVADGMGGHFGGEIASSTAIGILRESFLKEIQSLGKSKFSKKAILDLFKASFERANAAIYKASDGNNHHITMGTTLVAACIINKEVIIANVGDSRAYLFKKGKLKQITKDHSFIGMQMKWLNKENEVIERSTLRNIITRAIGARPDLEIDTFAKSLKDNQFLVLCSDGLYGELNKENIESVLSQEADAKSIVDRLIMMANQSGGKDNITVVVVGCKKENIEREHDKQQKSTKDNIKIALKIKKIFNKAK